MHESFHVEFIKSTSEFKVYTSVENKDSMHSKSSYPQNRDNNLHFLKQRINLKMDRLPLGNIYKNRYRLLHIQEIRLSIYS